MKKEQKKLLPPFLMIRSGLLNDLMLASGLLAGVCVADITLSDKQSIGYASLIVFVIQFNDEWYNQRSRKCMEGIINDMTFAINDLLLCSYTRIIDLFERSISFIS